MKRKCRLKLETKMGSASYTAARYSFSINHFETHCIWMDGCLSLSERTIEMSILAVPARRYLRRIAATKRQRRRLHRLQIWTCDHHPTWSHSRSIISSKIRRLAFFLDVKRFYLHTFQNSLGVGDRY